MLGVIIDAGWIVGVVDSRLGNVEIIVFLIMGRYSSQRIVRLCPGSLKHS